MNPKDSIFRVFISKDENKVFRGTAFAISPRWFVTCAHLFRDLQNTSCITLSGPAKYGDISNINWTFHPKLDCAIGELSPGIGEVESYIPVSLVDVTQDLGELKCLGFFDDTSGIQEWLDRVSGSSFTGNWVALQNTISDGISGGPVLLNDRAVAFVRADNLRTNQKYVLPIASIYSWLESSGFRTHSNDEGNAELSRVPISPPLRASEISDGVIRIFAKHLPDQNMAIRFVEKAMEARGDANEERFTDEQILVHSTDLCFAQPVTSVVFWGSVLMLAAEKSRRTVAALLLTEGAPDSRLMPESEARVYKKFYKHIINP